MAVSDVVDLLACPYCRSRLELATDRRSLRCVAGHAFDLARQGYANLSGGPQPRSADTAAMVAARERVLSSGLFDPLSRRLAERASGSAVVLDVGAGPGHYLRVVLGGAPRGRGVALDVSTAAARRAARSHPRVGAIVADAWRPLPLRAGGFDLVLSVFAPRNGPEFARVLPSGGRLLVVTPAAAHLAELRTGLGLLDVGQDKVGRLAEREHLQYRERLPGAALVDLVGMGPNAFHTTPAEVAARVARLATPIEVTVAVDLTVWVRGR